MAKAAYFDDEDDFDFEELDEILDYSHQINSTIDWQNLFSNISNPEQIKILQLNSNALHTLPDRLDRFHSLITLDLSNNHLVQLPSTLSSLINLKELLLKNNSLDDLALPKEFARLKQLEIVNLTGNCFKQFPLVLYRMIDLKEIYLGSNRISYLPDFFHHLNKVETLYLGGNQIGHIPDSIGAMQSLIVLNLSDNRLRTLPRSISRLTRLKSLSLHDNLFCALPPDIIRLDLQELSLRNNPLVIRFVRDLTYDVPTLKELAARTIKLHRISYDEQSIPKCLIEYLNSAKSCLNPKCQGVYFETCHKNIKFVDFCGKFYLPLLQFLCSPACTSTSQCSSNTHPEEMNSKFKKVLLG